MQVTKTITSPLLSESASLFEDVCLIIDEARRHVATYVNVEAVMLKRHVGKRIKEDVLFYQRAEYGKEILYGGMEDFCVMQLISLGQS